MKKLLLPVLALFISNAAMAAVEIGKPAPDFTAKAASGKSVKLSDYKGKIVVLEWSNPGCPFVKKFYHSNAMQKLQNENMAKDVVWLTINSSANGKEGYVDATAAKTFLSDKKAAPSEYLLDSEGTIGRLYDAKTTPHMFVIDTKGILAYKGAIDDKPTPNEDDIKGAHNYVTAAIDALIAGKPVEKTNTQPYGCTVKY